MSNETFEPLVLKVSARAVEHQNAIIMQTIQHIGGNQYMDITIDRNKVLEALADYVEKCRRADRETVTDKQQINELERLAQLIGKGERSLWCKRVGGMNGARRALAAYLLEHGVIVPPCKVGDKIFFIVNMSEHLAFNDFVTDDTVTKIGVTTKGILHEKGVDFKDFGKTVFLTREEAESALAVRKEDEGK